MGGPRVFISYSHKDEAWKDKLVRQLQVLELEDVLAAWDDRKIAVGDGWRAEIETAMEDARAAVLLISADFLTSDFIRRTEVPRLLQRRAQDGLRIIPLIVRPCPWHQVPWLAEIQCRPKDGRPLAEKSKVQAVAHARGPEVASRRLGVDPTEADRLPILVSLAAFEELLREGGGRPSLREFLSLYYERRHDLPGLFSLFSQALESGRALVLLDGLDEVVNPTARTYIAEQVALLVGELAPRGVRFVASSRLFGYLEAPVRDVPAWILLDFEEPDFETFAERWTLAWERAAGAGSSETPSGASRHARDLLADIHSSESVRRLAANPLMLTMLALLRRRLGVLPQRRVELFEAYVDPPSDVSGVLRRPCAVQA